ncbi:MAG: hypothetical protein LBN21_06510 [Treponema sp.]|jgi:hypothetical protein|nr:hypothetical protein [Treponema sp.]
MKRFSISPVVILSVILFLVFSCSEKEQYNFIGKGNPPAKKPDFYEGQGVDANGNGAPDYIVRNGRFIGSVSGKDFGPATLENFNARKSTRPASIKPSPVKPLAIPAAAANIQYANYANFRNYYYYSVRQFLDATGWTLTSTRSHELPEDIKNKIRKIGDYLHDHYTYGEYKSFDGIGQDDDHVFDCDDFAGLMYRMGREAGLEMYIISLPTHWANAVRYGNTLYTVEPQGIRVKYRDTSKFGNLTVADYARYTEQIVVEK